MYVYREREIHENMWNMGRWSSSSCWGGPFHGKTWGLGLASKFKVRSYCSTFLTRITPPKGKANLCLLLAKCGVTVSWPVSRSTPSRGPKGPHTWALMYEALIHGAPYMGPLWGAPMWVPPYGWRNKLVNTSLNHRIPSKIHRKHTKNDEMKQKSRNSDLTLWIAIFFDGDLDFHGINTSNLPEMKKKSKFRFI